MSSRLNVHVQIKKKDFLNHIYIPGLPEQTCQAVMREVKPIQACHGRPSGWQGAYTTLKATHPLHNSMCCKCR